MNSADHEQRRRQAGLVALRDADAEDRERAEPAARDHAAGGPARDDPRVVGRLGAALHQGLDDALQYPGTAADQVGLERQVREQEDRQCDDQQHHQVEIPHECRDLQGRQRPGVGHVRGL